jgi:hypothetical protein
MIRAAFPLLKDGGQGRGRTADLPLFRIKDGRLQGSTGGYLRCSLAIHGHTWTALDVDE